MPSRFRNLTPMLQVADMRATIDWYVSVLGFHLVGATDDNTWCRLERDGAALMFMRNDHLGAPRATATQYIGVENVEELWDALRDRVQVEWELQDMPYGLREFAIRDPNGYLLSFGEPILRGAGSAPPGP